ncbi:MAG: hypothetical protein H6728_07975 [Myxococcales bacterium]|nr:hypothetical protein [Myxococcales bacterium]MCB9642995.1 hypothetical protein [Myxococcales bacterium]
MLRIKNTWLICGLVCVWVLSASCINNQSSQENDPPVTENNRFKLEEYFPLQVGNRWTYRISSINSKPVERSVRIIKRNGVMFLDNYRESYALDSYGLRNNNVRYLLKYPLRVGTQWLSVTNITSVERYSIMEIDRKVKVPAGEYKNCLVVKAREQRAGQGAVEALFIFAPRIGLIKNVALRDDGSSRLVYNTMELVDFQVNREK